MATRNLNIGCRGQAGVNQSKYVMIRNEVETQVREELDPKGSNPGHHTMNKPITLSVDASQSGFGAMLFHEEKPIHYGSKSLTQSEYNYA